MNDAKTGPVQPQESVTPTSGGETKVKSSSSGDYDGAKTVGNMSELKKEAPELYHQMMISMAQKMCDDSRKQQEELKKIMREGQPQ